MGAKDRSGQVGTGAGVITLELVHNAQIGKAVAGASVLLRDHHTRPADFAHFLPELFGKPRGAVVDLKNLGFGHLGFQELSGGVLEQRLDFVQR